MWWVVKKRVGGKGKGQGGRAEGHTDHNNNTTTTATTTTTMSENRIRPSQHFCKYESACQAEMRIANHHATLNSKPTCGGGMSRCTVTISPPTSITYGLSSDANLHFHFPCIFNFDRTPFRGRFHSPVIPEHHLPTENYCLM